MLQLIGVAVSVAVMGSAARAAGPRHSACEGPTAETVVSYVDSWDDVLRFYRGFGVCIDGSVAEGLSDRIQRLWIERWETLPRMMTLTDGDSNCRAFVWLRIGDETFPRDSFLRLVELASTKCPPEAKEFCAAVLEEAANDTAK